MPPKKMDTVWEADAHTIAKIEILRAYLNAWFPILGSSRPGQPVLYIDGFAGPGEYTNYSEGSPVVVLTTATTAIQLPTPKWKAGTVNCYFIEDDDKRCENLRSRLAVIRKHPLVKDTILNSTFVDGIAEIQRRDPTAFTSGNPTFAFIDPFGATGVPFTVVRDILKGPCSEVLINLDADGAARIFKAEESASADENLTPLFGDDSWKTALNPGAPFDVLCKQVLDLYKAKLQSLPAVRYVFPFEMRGVNNSLNYYLVFASQNPLGLQKMKEAMKKLDQSGGYCFADGSVGQERFFRFDKPEDFADPFHQHFLGREVLPSELLDHALLNTPFTNPKSILRVLEDRGLIVAKSSNPKRRSGDFPEESLKSVVFLQAPDVEKAPSLFG